MRDFTNPVVTGMFILGALMILAATTSANAGTGNTNASATKHQQAASTHAQASVHRLIRREANLQMEVQRATSIQMQAERNAQNHGGTSTGHKPDAGCVICKID